MQRVSVIVPVYNGIKVIGETIENLLSSTYTNIEIVIIDDGSTDGAKEFCQEYAKMRKNIIFYSQNNQGIVSARNKGLELATGDFVCFCDQDDIVSSDIYEEMIEKINKSDSEVCICSTMRRSNNEDIPLELFEDDNYKNQRIIEELLIPVIFFGTKYGLSADKRRVGTIWKLMIKRTLLIKHNIHFRKYINHEDDQLFYLDVISKSKSVVTLSKTGYHWVSNLNSETYNWKYIERLPEKYSLYINDIMRIMYSCEISESLIMAFTNIYRCKSYVDILINEASINNSKTVKEKIPYLRTVIYDNHFNTAIQFRNRFYITSIKNRICYTLLNYRCIRCAYYFCQIYKKIREERIKKSNGWFKLEWFLKSQFTRLYKISNNKKEYVNYESGRR